MPDTDSSGTALHCANCGAALVGPYCAQCGQQAGDSARSLAAFLRDATGELTNADGRVWRTLGPLLTSPGRLTNEFFAGRRARYLPPFRLYLVVSLVFFAVSGSSLVSSARPDLRAPRAEARSSLTAEDCEKADIHLFGIRRLEDLSREACRRVAERGPAAAGRVIAQNIPPMMFIFLPLMAAVMVPLYWRPRRYYVEHLVFFLHNHAALFLAYTLVALLLTASATLHVGESIAPVVEAGLAIYAAWYAWAALRRHYGQGKALTFCKYVLIALAYGACLVMTFVGTAIVSVLAS